ncbi:S8 family serine peptidase, partial [Amycolatopsis kentuckyensis]|uniref:S8 family serine peptidase n=1 Tax=Amycolatopsis kentuckyensis TaxID=218823 RepID=UPI003EB6D789
AGIAAGKDYGVAKGAQIVPVRVLDKDGGGATDRIIAGIDWVAQNAQQPAVAVLGIGGVPNDQLDAAVKRLATVVPIAVPAGSETADASGYSPARVPEALTVAAADTQDRPDKTSNSGQDVDLYAP